MTNPQCIHKLRVPLNVFSEQIIEQSTTFIDQCNKASTGGEVLGVRSHVFGKIVDSL